jgi:hypothetical protein
MPCSSVVFPAAILFSFSFIATRVARVAGGRCYALCFSFFLFFLDLVYRWQVGVCYCATALTMLPR